MFLSQKCRVQTICTIIFRVYCYPMKRKYANGLKYQTQALMGAFYVIDQIFGKFFC